MFSGLWVRKENAHPASLASCWPKAETVGFLLLTCGNGGGPSLGTG